MLRFNCPECHTKIEVDERFAGQTGKCKECGAPITVPAAQELQATGLEALLGKPDAAVYGAYNKAPDATWDDPAAQAEAPAPRKEEEPIPLPEIPEEILAAAKARKNKTMQYIIAAIVLALLIMVLALPLLMPKPKPAESPTPATPPPAFGEQQQQ